MEQIACHRVGAVKERLFVQNLLEIPVPVVPLSVQRKVVAASETARHFAAESAAKIERLERDIEARFLADLGLAAPDKATLPRAFGVWWSDFLRWSVSYNQLSQAGMDISRSRYALVDVGSLAELMQCGTSEKGNTAGDGTPVIRMNNILNGVL